MYERKLLVFDFGKPRWNLAFEIIEKRKCSQVLLELFLRARELFAALVHVIVDVRKATIFVF